MVYEDLISLYSKRTFKILSVEYKPISVKSEYLRVYLANENNQSSSIECRKCYSELSEYENGAGVDHRGYMVSV